MEVAAFINKWSKAHLFERAASQEYYLDADMGCTELFCNFPMCPQSEQCDRHGLVQLVQSFPFNRRS